MFHRTPPKAKGPLVQCLTNFAPRLHSQTSPRLGKQPLAIKRLRENPPCTVWPYIFPDFQASFLEDFPIISQRSCQVSMDFMANGLLALGAHPAMVHSVEELDVAPGDPTWPKH